MILGKYQYQMHKSHLYIYTHIYNISHISSTYIYRLTYIAYILHVFLSNLPWSLMEQGTGPAASVQNVGEQVPLASSHGSHGRSQGIYPSDV